MRVAPPPSPEPTSKGDLDVRAEPPLPSNPKKDFGMRAILTPSPEPEQDISMRTSPTGLPVRHPSSEPQEGRDPRAFQLPHAEESGAIEALGEGPSVPRLTEAKVVKDRGKFYIDISYISHTSRHSLEMGRSTTISKRCKYGGWNQRGRRSRQFGICTSTDNKQAGITADHRLL